MPVVSASPHTSLRLLLLAGASAVVLGALLVTTPGGAATDTVSSNTTTIPTITSGNSLVISSGATITSTSADGGVEMSVGATIGSIVNNGVITGGFYGITNGSFANGSGSSAGSITTITNTGTIASSNGAIRILSGGVNRIDNSGSLSGGAAIGLSSGAVAGTITNSGTITPTGTSAAISLSGNATLSTLVNTGILSGGIQGTGVRVTGTASSIGLVSNSSTITARTGVAVDTGTLATLSNSGLIYSYNTSGSAYGALYVGTAGAMPNVINTGTISGIIRNSATSAMTITGASGTLFGTIMGTTTSTAGTIQSSGDLTFAGNTFLDSWVSMSGVGRTVTNTGILQITRPLPFTPASYVQGSGATLILGVTSASTYGQLLASGSAVTLTGSTIVMQTVSGGSYGSGTYTIVNAGNNSTLTGAGVTVTGFNGDVTTTIVGNKLQVILAPPLYWDGDAGGNATNGTIDGGNGTWSTASTNWTRTDGTRNDTLAGGLVPVFQGTAGQVTVSGSVSTAGMTFATTGYQLTGGTIGLSDSPRITTDTGVTATVASALSGSAGMTKAGAGTLILSGSNSFTGNVTITGGTLTANGGTVLPDSGFVSIASGTTLKLGASETIGMPIGAGTLDLDSHTVTTSVSSMGTLSGSVTGTGALVKAGSGSLVLTGANSHSGGTSITGGTLTAGSSALPSSGAVMVGTGAALALSSDLTVGALSGAGNLALGAYTLTAGDATSGTLSGTIGGTGTLVKAGSGTLTLAGTGSHTGGTSITGGTLSAASATALPAAGAVSVGSGATLRLDASLAVGALSGAGDVVLGSNTLTFGDAGDTTLSGAVSGAGTLVKAGSGIATLSGANAITGGLTLNGGSMVTSGTLGAVTIASGATLTAAGAITTAAIANSGTLALGSTVLTASGNITGTGAITFTIGSGGTGYIVNTVNTANYAPGAGTVTVTPTLSGVTITNGATVALIRGNAGSTAPSFTGTTLSVAATGAATWTAAAGTAYVGTVDLNGYTITANDTVLVATVASPPPPPPPPPPPVVTPPTETTPTTPTTPVVTPPVVTPPVVVTPPTVTTGVIDGSKPTFTNEDGAVQSTTVTFDGGTLKPTAPLTLTQAVNVQETNGVIDPNGSTVTLSGSVTGAGRLTVAGSGSLIVSNTVANSGGVNVQSGGLIVAGGGTVSAPVTVGGGTVTVGDGGNVSAPVTVTGGAITIDDGGTVASSVTVESGGSARVNGEVAGPVTVASGATLGGSGLIGGSTSVSGILAPGNSPGTLVFTAPLTLNAGSVYQVEIDGTGTGTGAGNHDRVVVDGASFTAGGRLTPILRGIAGSATNSFTPALGQSFTVVTASDGVSGRFATLDQPTAGLAAGTRLDLLYGSNAIALVSTPTSYADLGAAGLAQSSNQRAVGAALESFRPAAGGQASDTAVQTLFDNLHTLSGGQIGPALNQLSGVIHTDMLAAGQANRRLFGRAVEARQAAGRGGAEAPGPVAGVVQFLFDGKARSASGLAEGPDGTAKAAAGKASLWGQPLVGRGRSGNDGNGGTVDRFIGGFMVGSDYAFDPDLKAGAALGFLRTRVKADGGAGKGTVDSYQATAYASWTPGAAFVDAALGYGHSRYETSRSVTFGNVAGVASGEANGNDLSAELSAGTRVALDDASWVEPRVGLRWDRLARGSFTESGTPLLSLTEESETWTGLRSSVGLRAGTRLSFGEAVVEPTGLLGWEHDWNDVGASATGALNGARFTVQSSRPGRDAAVVGAGVNVTVTQQVSVQVSYLGEIRRRESNHGLSAGLRWSW